MVNAGSEREQGCDDEFFPSERSQFGSCVHQTLDYIKQTMPTQHRPELEDILSEKLFAVEAVGDGRIDDDNTEIVEEARPGFCVECKDQEVNGGPNRWKRCPCD